MNDYMIKQFLWRADNPETVPDNYESSIRFPKKLGYKCDSVGWCCIEQVTECQLDTIFKEAKKENLIISGE